MGRTRRFASTLGLALPVLLSLATTQAAIINWTAAPATPGSWSTPANWATTAVPGAIDTASINNGGTANISSGSAAIDALAVGQLVNSTLNQTGGSLTLNTGSIGAGSFYNFSGGSLTINNSGQFNLLGQLNFGFGTSSITVNDSGVLDLSKGSVINASNNSITAAANTVVYLPVGVTTSSFKSFSSLGEVYQVNGTALVVPAGFTMTISQDRTDQIQVQGTLKPTSGNNLSLKYGGVTVMPGGTFDLSSGWYFYVQTATGSGMTGGTLSTPRERSFTTPPTMPPSPRAAAWPISVPSRWATPTPATADATSSPAGPATSPTV